MHMAGNGQWARFYQSQHLNPCYLAWGASGAPTLKYDAS